MIIETTCPDCKGSVNAEIPDDLPAEMKETFKKIAVRGILHDSCDSHKRALEERNRVTSLIDARIQQWETLCPPEFRKEISFDFPTAKKESWDKIANWKPERGLLIHGKTGKCKTRFVYAMLSKFHEEGMIIAAMTHAEFRHQVTLWAGNDTMKLKKLLDSIRNADIWFIDDLGNGKNTPSSEEAFEMVLDCRVREGRPCIFTTNVPVESIPVKLSVERGEAIARRIRDYCTPVEFV